MGHSRKARVSTVRAASCASSSRVATTTSTATAETSSDRPRRRRLTLAAALIAIAIFAATTHASHATFKGPNGLLIYQAQVGANTQLFTIQPDGSGVTQITHFKDSSADGANWAPGGRRIVFDRHWHPEGGPNERLVIYTANFDGSGLRAAAKAGTAAIGPNWLRDGRRIIFLDYSTGVGRLKLTTASGTPTRSAGIPGTGGDSPCSLPGNRVAFLRPKAGSDDVTAIFVGGLSGHGLKRITPWGGHADKIDCSPDGGRIVFSMPAFGQNGESSNVFTIRTDGSDLVQLTKEKGGDVNAGADSWSPDGTKIAYVTNRSGSYQIWTMNADGTEQKQLTDAADAHLAAWGSHP
jgi:Tol biopolymer transport system component